ncbi:PD-(D/E)XK nuclease family protein, partial [Acidisphaera rubrifaciens]|uniref:PD-(D/E)XK nuclease family protein n=1 Tax=Acidisphaera rubrifaciens TaxID=50715 RepID=UPI0006627572
MAALGAPSAVHAEIAGDFTLTGPGGPFVLHGRADRIERHGETLTVLDYKTGHVPHQSQVELGYSPQMTLLAAMAEAGAFAGVTGSVGALAYWRLTGGRTPGEIKALFADEDDTALRDAIAGALDGLRRLIETYD